MFTAWFHLVLCSSLFPLLRYLIWLLLFAFLCAIFTLVVFFFLFFRFCSAWKWNIFRCVWNTSDASMLKKWTHQTPIIHTITEYWRNHTHDNGNTHQVHAHSIFGIIVDTRQPYPIQVFNLKRTSQEIQFIGFGFGFFRSGTHSHRINVYENDAHYDIV